MVGQDPSRTTFTVRPPTGADARTQALILVLIYETRPESPWKPYIDLFPTEFNSLMFWSPAELSLLRGSAVLDKIGREDAEDLFKTKVLPVIQVRLPPPPSPSPSHHL